MLRISVGGKEYKVRYGYRVLCETDLIDRVTEFVSSDNGSNTFQKVMALVADLLLAGLQKYHSDKFGYDTEAGRKEALRKVYDLMDEYEDEATEEEPKDAFSLFKMLQDELLRNGFLSRIRRETAEEAQEMDAARVPTDHQK